jgi:hypothetical protein
MLPPFIAAPKLRKTQFNSDPDRTLYHLLKYHVQYEDMGAEEFERQHRERDIKVLRKKAAKLGFTLVESLSAQIAA